MTGHSDRVAAAQNGITFTQSKAGGSTISRSFSGTYYGIDQLGGSPILSWTDAARTATGSSNADLITAANTSTTFTLTTDGSAHTVTVLGGPTDTATGTFTAVAHLTSGAAADFTVTNVATPVSYSAIIPLKWTFSCKDSGPGTLTIRFTAPVSNTFVIEGMYVD